MYMVLPCLMHHVHAVTSLILTVLSADKTWELDSVESDRPFFILHCWRQPWLHFVAWSVVCHQGQQLSNPPPCWELWIA